VWREEREFDAVTCMFALHYFFVSEQALRMLLANVARNLKPGARAPRPGAGRPCFGPAPGRMLARPARSRARCMQGAVEARGPAQSAARRPRAAQPGLATTLGALHVACSAHSRAAGQHGALLLRGPRWLISVHEWVSMRAGGYFFGTVASGRRVQETIKASGRWPSLRLPLLALDARWLGEAAPFGCAYNCAIGDTVTQGARARRCCCLCLMPDLLRDPSSA
jgi:hypothetical protein